MVSSGLVTVNPMVRGSSKISWSFPPCKWKKMCVKSGILTHWGRDKMATLCRQHFHIEDLIEQQAITWANADPDQCHYTTSLCHNEFRVQLHSGKNYRQVSNIRRTWVGNEIVDRSDVVEALPVCAAPTTSSFSTEHLASIYCAKTTASRVKKHLSFGIWCVLY